MTLSNIIMSWLKEKYPDICIVAGDGIAIAKGPEEYIFYRSGSVNYYFINIYNDPLEVGIFSYVKKPHINPADPKFFDKLEVVVNEYLKNNNYAFRKDRFLIQKYS